MIFFGLKLMYFTLQFLKIPLTFLYSHTQINPKYQNVFIAVVKKLGSEGIDQKRQTMNGIWV